MLSRWCGQADGFLMGGRAGAGGASCSEEPHFYLEHAKAVAKFVPVLQVIFFCTIMTPHHGVGGTEVGSEMGGRARCPEQARSRNGKALSPKPTAGMTVVLATLAFFFPVPGVTQFSFRSCPHHFVFPFIQRCLRTAGSAPGPSRGFPSRTDAHSSLPAPGLRRAHPIRLSDGRAKGREEIT